MKPATLSLAALGLVIAGITGSSTLITPITPAIQQTAQQTTSQASTQNTKETTQKVQSPLSVKLMDATAITIAAPENANTGPFHIGTTVFVLNDGDEVCLFPVDAVFQDDFGNKAFLYPGEGDDWQTPVTGKSLKAVHITLKGLQRLPDFNGYSFDVKQSLNGYFSIAAIRATTVIDPKIVDAENRKCPGVLKPGLQPDVILSRALKVVPYTPSFYSKVPVVFGLIVTAVIFAVCGILLILIKLRKWPKLSPETADWGASMGFPVFLSVFGSLITAVLPSIGLQTHIMQRNEYTTLSMLFGLLVTLSGPIMGLARPQKSAASSPSEAQPRNDSVWLLLFCSFITMFGIFGQLFILYYLLDELWKALSLSNWAFYSFAALLGSLGVVLALSSGKLLIGSISPALAEAEALKSEP